MQLNGCINLNAIKHHIFESVLGVKHFSKFDFSGLKK